MYDARFCKYIWDRKPTSFKGETQFCEKRCCKQIYKVWEKKLALLFSYFLTYILPTYVLGWVTSLKIWGFLRLRIEFGQISRIFEDEGYIKLLRFLTLKPQKTSMFEVRMRGVILRFFEDSSKNLEKKSKNRVFF